MQLFNKVSQESRMGRKKSKLEFCVQKLQEELREYKEHIPPCWNIWVASSLRRQWDIMKLDK